MPRCTMVAGTNNIIHYMAIYTQSKAGIGTARKLKLLATLASTVVLVSFSIPSPGYFQPRNIPEGTKVGNISRVGIVEIESFDGNT